MPRFAANISLLFQELPILDRFYAARSAGFEAVEMLFPYDHNINALASAAEDADCKILLINTPVTDWAAGDRGCAAVPGAESRFREDFQRALDAACLLNTRFIHVMAGIAEGRSAHEVFLNNLIWATDQVTTQVLTIEPINSHDIPGYFLNNFEQAEAVIKTIGAPNLKLQFDAYHAQRITGSTLNCWNKFRHLAAHIQIAGVPGRNEPDGGEINYPVFFRQLDHEGYTGVVSGEYHPAGRTQDGLRWIGR